MGDLQHSLVPFECPNLLRTTLGYDPIIHRTPFRHFSCTRRIHTFHCLLLSVYVYHVSHLICSCMFTVTILFYLS